jgi:hypothetical protein
MTRIKILLVIHLMFCFCNLQAIEGILLATTDYTFQDKWYKTVSASVPQIMSTKEIYRGQNMYVAIIVGDFDLNEKKEANITYDIVITNPKRKEYLNKEKLPAIVAQKANAKHLQMGDAVLKMVFTEKDAFGKYKIKIKVKDLVSGKSKVLKLEFILKKLPAYDNFKVKNEQDFSKWQHYYYKEQNPEAALAHYIYYAKSEMSEQENSFLPMFSTLLEIVNQNTFLLEHILAAYEKEDETIRFHLIYLLHYSDLDATDFLEGLEGIEKDAYVELQKSALPDPYGLILNPAQLDMLWSEFMTSGSYKTILKLIETLDYVKYEGGIEAYKQSAQTEEDRTNLINNAIYDALVWSFTSNCEQHPLVKKYALWALENEDLSEVQKEELGKILN